MITLYGYVLCCTEVEKITYHNAAVIIFFCYISS